MGYPYLRKASKMVSVGLKLTWVWVNTYRYIFSGMNIHLPAILGFTRYQGFDPSPLGKFTLNGTLKRHEKAQWLMVTVAAGCGDSNSTPARTLGWSQSPHFWSITSWENHRCHRSNGESLGNTLW